MVEKRPRGEGLSGKESIPKHMGKEISSDAEDESITVLEVPHPY